MVHRLREASCAALVIAAALLGCKKDGVAGADCRADDDCKNGLLCEARVCIPRETAEKARAAEGAAQQAGGLGSPGGTTTPGATATATATATTGDERNTVPDPWTYPETGFTPLAASCTDPYVVVVTLPPTAPEAYDYYYTRYVLAAFPSFREVPSPSGPKQLAFREVNRNKQRSLVAKAGDAATANKFTAAYRKAVAGATPQPVCGAGVSGWNDLRRSLTLKGGELLPPPGDAQPAVQQQCARIGVCMALLRPDPGHNPGVDCLRKPTQFDRQCSRRPSCGEVVTCLGK